MKVTFLSTTLASRIIGYEQRAAKPGFGYNSTENVNFYYFEGKFSLKQWETGGFSGGSVVRNPLPNAGDTGLIPYQGRPHMSQNN